MPPPRPHPKDHRSGFALLITITLLAFLVLLLVSLASLTRVETQVASNTQQLSKARQNALMALNIAMGRLQALAGPDQRITATADLIAGVHDTKRRWTGVWDTTAASPSPEWLVSTASGAVPTGTTTSLTTALASTGTVPLVGDKTADTSVPGNGVAVETQAITADVPGLSGPQTIGRYAYWVGDEGVKAKVSLADPWAASTATPDEKSYRLKVAQRSGIESVDKDDTTMPVTDRRLDTAYPANAPDLSKILDLKQLPLVNTAGQADLADAAKNRFHDLTATSYSVLADVAQGGLKKDLTAWLAHPSGLPATAPLDTDFMAPLDTADSTGYTMPRWGLLRSYANLVGGTTPLPPKAQDDQQAGFHPLVSYFRVAFGVSCAGLDQLMYAHMFPVVVLWNPYDTPIASSQYEFVFGTHFVGNQVIYKSNGSVKARLILSSSPWLAGSASPSPDTGGLQQNRGYTRLLLDSPVIQPGQSLVFTLNNSGWYYTPGTNPNAIMMSPQNPPATDNSLWFALPSVVFTATDVANAAANKITVQLSGGQLDFALYPPQLSSSGLNVAQWRQFTPYHLVQHFGLTQRADQPMTVPTDPLDAVPYSYYWHRLPVTTELNNQYYRNARWLANLNPLSPLHMQVPGSPSLAGVYLNDNTHSSPPLDTFDGNQVSAGYYRSPIPAQPLQVAELLHSATDPGARLFSLAQLQHVTFSKLVQNPTYAVGNSEVHYLVGRTATSVLVAPSATAAPPANLINRVYDLSYLLNKTLWDHYFFSTIPQSLTNAQASSDTFHLPNARHTFYRKDGIAPTALSLTEANAFDTASSRLLVNGGFNINSTSEQAWRALLASHNGVDSAGANTHPYSRFSSTQIGDSANQPRTSAYRILSDDQINRLARNIVDEVKSRGPFLSLADFVNRRLADDAAGYKGPLQAAIDATDAGTTAAERINDLDPFNATASQIGLQSYFPKDPATTDQQKLHLASDEDPGVARTRPSGSRAAFMPGFLTQADLLNSLGPVLAARSDTFVIRAYGDVQNPATSSVEGKAWCEAVVQRLPDYVDDSMPAETDLAAAPASAAKDTNLAFGRRFKIISFRWLAAGDI
ncbi:MAG TPA: hypothetical protein VIO38_01255 [Rariglobus sp.]